MKGAFNIGEATISEEALKEIAGSAAIECFGIVGMASISKADGLVRLLTGDSLAKGVEIAADEEGIQITFHIIAAYGVSILAVTQNLIENVKYRLESFTGLRVLHVDIFVEGVKPID